MHKIAQQDAVGSTAPDASTVNVDKGLATLKAELALRGFSVHDTVTDGWLVARWNLSHFCTRIEDLEAFLRRVGGAE
ncbi:hypothetical protein [Variovorax sp. dw_308]|uniref:hypothetical protein n=1 Tax=Variovorax sp. dw_308 TaxID=2721546 RepID=UPI001C4387F1|nr:hypothetical protein [Variovorax sp. dw_308]